MPPSRPAPPLTVPPAGPYLRRSRRGLYLFGAVYAAMLIGGFEVGFQAGSPRPTPPAKSTQLASARTATTVAKPETTAPPQVEPTPKAKPPEPKPPEPKAPEAKEPDPKPMPEPPPKKPEPEPEPKKPESPMPKPGAEVAFAKVAPVFKDKCGVCHGGANAKGGLDLRSAKMAIAGGDNGEAVKPGAPDESLLWKRIVDENEPMPPKGKPKLTAEEKKLIKEWIAAGAK